MGDKKKSLKTGAGGMFKANKNMAPKVEKPGGLQGLTFDDLIGLSVKGNPKPKPKKNKQQD